MYKLAAGIEYWAITTQEVTYGGMMKRFNPEQKITDYLGVTSILESSAKVVELEGKILAPRCPSPPGATSLFAWIQRAMSLGYGKLIRRLNE